MPRGPPFHPVCVVSQVQSPFPAQLGQEAKVMRRRKKQPERWRFVPLLPEWGPDCQARLQDEHARQPVVPVDVAADRPPATPKDKRRA